MKEKTTWETNRMGGLQLGGLQLGGLQLGGIVACVLGCMVATSWAWADELAGAAEPAAGQAGSAGRPNIVVILADDLGRRDCTFMGGQISTPHLDSLAAKGARLDAFYVQPVCSPTRAALMTGRYPMRHGLQVGVVRPWARYGLPLEERTLAEALKTAGYATAICGKWHLGHFQKEYQPTQRGFDFQYGHYNGAIDYFTHERDGGFDWHRNDQVCRDEGYSTHLIGREAAAVVKEHAGKRPFFLYVPFNAVHSPYQTPEKYMEPYAHMKADRRSYAGMLAAMDEAVGQIVQAVQQAGVADQTLFVFSSDNGGPAPGRITDNTPYRAGKGTLYEGGVRVVAFATYPNQIAAGTTIHEPLHMVDLYPTLINLAGGSLEQPLPIDGLDIWPVLTAGAKSPHEAILLNTTPRAGAVRSGKWKLLRKSGEDDPDGNDTQTTAETTIELYDLERDVGESQNVAAEHPDIVASLTSMLDQYAGQAVPPKSKPKPRNFQSPAIWGQP